MDGIINATMDILSPRDIEDPKSRVFFYMASEPSVSIKEEQWDIMCGQNKKCSFKKQKKYAVFVETPPVQRDFCLEAFGREECRLLCPLGYQSSLKVQICNYVLRGKESLR
ncbi:hypothetical protein X801_07291 [Opisthorchis viverrini]|nr:hypothetical protein X801_07291 [Opisthorchis viverrini]